MTQSHDYRGAFGADGTRNRVRREIPEVPAEAGLVVEDPASGFCGAVVGVTVREVTLEDRHGGRDERYVVGQGQSVTARRAGRRQPPRYGQRPGG